MCEVPVPGLEIGSISAKTLQEIMIFRDLLSLVRKKEESALLLMHLDANIRELLMIHVDRINNSQDILQAGKM